MQKNLKIRGEFHWKFKDFFATKILSRWYSLERVEEGPDLTIGLVEPRPITDDFKKSPKKILVSGENLYYRINLFKFLEYMSKKTKVKLDILNKILPRKILDIKLGLIRKEYLMYVNKIAQNAPSGEYAIICNDIKGKNILNLPFFLQVKEIRANLNRLSKKVEKKDIPNKFCCLIVSNESAFDRIEFVKKLSKYKKVDIYGKTSLTNSDNELLPKSWSQNTKFLSQYKFVIAFENSFEDEYITEKLPNAMLAGSIPIYRGAQNVSKYFNIDSFINFDDYEQSYDKMIEKIVELDSNDKKCREFMKRPWTTKKNVETLMKKENELINFLMKI